MLAQTPLKYSWIEFKQDNVSTSLPTVYLRERSSAASGTLARALRLYVKSFTVDAQGTQHSHILRRSLHDETQEVELLLALKFRNPTRVNQIRNIVWSPHELEESLSRTLDLARRRHFETLVTVWETETVFVSSVTEKWDHHAYQSIISMGKPALPLILEQVHQGEPLWTQALFSITGENPAEATRTPEEARQAWLKWGEERVGSINS